MDETFKKNLNKIYKIKDIKAIYNYDALNKDKNVFSTKIKIFGVLLLIYIMVFVVLKIIMLVYTRHKSPDNIYELRKERRKKIDYLKMEETNIIKEEENEEDFNDEDEEEDKKKKNKKDKKKKLKDEDEEEEEEEDKKKKNKKDKKKKLKDEDEDEEEEEDVKKKKKNNLKKNEKNNEKNGKKEKFKKDNKEEIETIKTRNEDDNDDNDDNDEDDDNNEDDDDNKNIEDDKSNKKELVEIFRETNHRIEDLYYFISSFKDNIKTIEEILAKVNLFEKAYKKYVGISRFSIPVIGKINCGKSTFLNFMIHLNGSLEINAEIATKFICIIRHNKKNKKPIIYETKAIERGDNSMFNFKKGKLLGKNINEIISKRNQEIIKNKDIIIDPLYYFLIIEVNIPLFNGEFEKYANLFEFMDVPGLNEVAEKSGKNEKVNDNFYFKEIMPIIIPNIKFSILIFDSLKFNDEDTKDIVTLLEQQMGKEVILNSIFVLNKIDKIDEPSKQKEFIQSFIKTISNKKELSFLKNNLNDSNVIGISSILLLKKSFKFDSFDEYLDCILEEAIQDKNQKKKIENNFSDYLFRKFKNEIHKVKEFDYSDDSEESEEKKDEKEKEKKKEKEEDEEEEEEEEEKEKESVKPTKLQSIKEILKRHFEGNFSKKEYEYYKKKFEKYKDNINKTEDQELKKIENIFGKIMKKIIDDHIKMIQPFVSIKDDAQNSLHLEKNEMQLITKTLKFINLLNKFQNNPSILENPKLINEEIGKKIEKLFLLQDIDIVKNIQEKYERNTILINQDRKLRFLTLGGYSSGKSTLLNTVIIGRDILPSSAKECTTVALIIKHVDSEKDVALYEGLFKIDQENKFYNISYDSSAPLVTNINKVKSCLENLNKNANKKIHKKKGIQFYILQIPLKIFDYIEDQSLKDSIEFIDYPGLDTDFNNYDGNMDKNNINSKSILEYNTNALLAYTNGFLFINNGIQVLEHSNRVLLTSILDIIRGRNSDFSFKSCLFIMNKCDEAEIDIEKSRLDFVRLINQIQKDSVKCKDRLCKKNEIKNINDVNVTKFSSILFNEYLIYVNQINNFQEILNKCCEKKKEIEETLNSLEKNLKKKFIKIKSSEFEQFKFNNEEIQRINLLIVEYLKEKGYQKVEQYNSKISEIAKIYIYLKNSLKLNNQYIGSNGEHFFNCLHQVLLISKSFYENSIQKDIIQFLFGLYEKFIIILKSINEDSKNINPEEFTKEKMNKNITYIKNEAKQISIRINEKIYNMKELIKQNIDRMHQNKNKSRNDFQEIAKAITINNSEILNETQEEINKIITEFTTKMKIFTDAIKNLTKNAINKYDYNNLSVEQINHTLSTYIREEKNIAEKMLDNTAFLVISCIPIINVAQWGIAGIAGLLDYLRNHKEEYEGIIKEYEKSVNQNISIFQDNVENNIKSIEKNSCEIIMINGNDLNKIKKNQKTFEAVIEDLENYFLNMVENKI